LDLTLEDGIYTVETVEKLVDRLVDSELESADNVLIVKTLADWCRKKENRDEVIKSSRLLQSIIHLVMLTVDTTVTPALFKISSTQTQAVALCEQICRLLGNLTFDHEANRKIINQLEQSSTLFSAVNTWILQTEYAVLKRNAITAMLNMASDDEDIQDRFIELGLVTYLLSILTASSGAGVDEALVDVCGKALRTMEENTKLKTIITIKDINQLHTRLSQTLKDDGWIGNDLAKDIVSLINEISKDNEPIMLELLKGGVLTKLLDYIDDADAQRAQVYDQDEEDLAEISSEDLSFAPTAAEVLVKLAEKNALRHFFHDTTGVVERMLTIVGAKTPTFAENTKQTQLKVLDMAKVKRNITRAVAYVSIDDKNVDIILKNINLFVEIFKQEDTEQIVSAAMIVGNIALSDPNITKLLSLNIVELMSATLKLFPNHQPVQHLILSSLRNITSPRGPFKGTVVKQELMNGVIGNMIVENQVIQYAAVELLKNFILGCDTNYTNFIESGGLQPLCNLANGITKSSMDEGEDTEEGRAAAKHKDKRVAYESSRIILRMLSTRDLLPSEQRQAVVTASVRPMFELSYAPYAILSSEGVRGLSIIAKLDGGPQSIMQHPDWWTTLLNLLQASIVSTKEAERQFNIDTQQHILDILTVLTKDGKCSVSGWSITHSFKSINQSINLYYPPLDNRCQELKVLGAVASLKELAAKNEITAITKTGLQNILVQLS
ncbi:hypothetical protein SAMD00019534_102700, partial [Acytostelium subglobosum LB1]|uniref:hypothetical protein n=1 Tax=Acytostelium subglobosum LB1 TaxID=1410327 RepID=UPI000644B2C9